KDPNNKNHWVIDEPAAKVVREIFDMCMSGLGPTQIANRLSERNILIPVAHSEKEDFVHYTVSQSNKTRWSDSTVKKILSRMEYLGHTVNFKSRRKSFKNKKKIENDPSEWKIFKNTHEAIIDEETWKTVQRIRENRRRVKHMADNGMLSGMLFCGQCGAKLYQVRCHGWDHSQEYFNCSAYQRDRAKCSSHQIRNIVVEKILLEDLQRITAFARENEEKFIQIVNNTSAKAIEKELSNSKRECEKAKMRIKQLDIIIQKLYEDKVLGNLSDERFQKMSTDYEEEQVELKQQVILLNQFIDETKNKVLNTYHFLDLVHKYTDITELNAQIIREFVEKIIVHRSATPEGKKIKELEIVYNCIGSLNLPQK
ncbi:MAG: recombinase family protein, partial [Clostridia bacterium]|nr:recombinase family protein [Clostridia bacterium]